MRFAGFRTGSPRSTATGFTFCFEKGLSDLLHGVFRPLIHRYEHSNTVWTHMECDVRPVALCDLLHLFRSKMSLSFILLISQDLTEPGLF